METFGMFVMIMTTLVGTKSTIRGNEFLRMKIDIWQLSDVRDFEN